MNFIIDQAYVCSVTISKTWSIYDGKDNLTEDELVQVLLGKDRCTSFWSEDHPEFSKLREQLGEKGYIEIQRNWSNGDYVTKPFSLNGVKFKVNSRFLSACAIKLG